MAPSADFRNYLEQTRIPLRLACATKSGHPLVLSLWFLYEDGILYCATQESARVVEYLRHDPRCAFEIAADTPPYCGVRGQGEGRINAERGDEILERLLARYLGDTKQPLAQKLLGRGTPEVALEITPLNWHSWNFTERMRDSLPESDDEKVCPD